jgi:hypothetical protein
MMTRSAVQAVTALLLAGLLLLPPAQLAAQPGTNDLQVQGESRVWHALTLTVWGPEAEERGDVNPFRDFRVTATFTHGDTEYVVPGYFAADGNAGETGAERGNKWRVHFVPDLPGDWSYRVSIRHGKDVALSSDPEAGSETVLPPTSTGPIAMQVQPSDKSPPDLRGHGRLRYVGQRYLQFAGSGEYWLKGGADSPENFLAYADFDGTRALVQEQREGESAAGRLHRYEPHLGDWREGDPTWQGGKGKGIIGAINYLAEKGVNSQYFITMNVEGDGKDVWPWVDPDVRDRFDCSKLDQWNTVFDHMQRRGIVLHVLTQETENDQLLDGGELGPLRKLYYRELVARFGHHLGVVWNLGEENTNTSEQQKVFAAFIKEIDPYDSPIVVHTFPDDKEKVYAPLVGAGEIDGPSLQVGGGWETIPALVREWTGRSAAAGHPWVVCVDELGPADRGIDPDARQLNNQAEARTTALWGSLMAGGAGVEWYFGYTNAHNDLNLEDFRSREAMWDTTRYALEFFRQIPFHRMQPHDELIEGDQAQCLAAPGEVYAIYLPNGGDATLDLGESEVRYEVKWYNPRNGGALQDGRVTAIAGTGKQDLGRPPSDEQQDWAVLLRKSG